VTTELRAARREDLPGILDLYAHLNPEDAPLAPERAQALWAEIEAMPGIRYLVAVSEGRVVSTCNVTVLPNLTRGGRSLAIVENMVTAPDFRRRGIGKRLLELAVAFAREKGCYKISLLSSAKRQEAHVLYEAAGFDGAAKKAFYRALE
jgi:GNAT superfamily N-acetyltransferase